MASMRELAMELLSRSGTGPVLQPTNVYGQDPDLPIGYCEGEISPLDAAAMSTMFVPGVGDVTGLAADVDMYMRDPESRNLPNYLLTAAGALPFLPAASVINRMRPKDDFTAEMDRLELETGLTREQRLEQGYPETVYHGTKDPSIEAFVSRNRVKEPGTFVATDPIQAASYGPITMPLRINSENFAVVDFDTFSWHQAPEDAVIKFPDGTEIKVGGMDTDQIADIARENGAPGLKFKNIIDIGHDINIQPDTRNLPLELVQSKEYQEKYMEPLQNYYDAGGADQYAIFDTSRIRSINAKADPAQKESSEILATIAPMAVGTGAAYMVRPSRSQDEET